ncbi:S8 family serine peptidase [Halorussus salinisoli]|uniref:S8 family serine peptidase n=1 Tax=Halorussus salinisoli TaxID=2558242 RepID=UPI0010C1BF4F|nr:S8 family serine peptidase [Halorussus salinisoli]
MRGDSTRHGERRTTEGVTALLLSVLLLTSAVAPAVGGDVRTTSGPPTTPGVVSQTTDHARTTEHPAEISGADATTVSEDTENESLSKNATTKRVTLVTGQTVTVVETGNRTEYSIDSNVTMQRVSTPKGTYIFPEGVDFDTFDRDLFNVDLLVQQNATDEETSSIPVIVSHEQRKRYADSDGNQGSVDVLDSVAGTEKTDELETIDAVAGRLSKDDAKNAYRTLAESEEVERVHLDVKYEVDLDDAATIVSGEEAREKYGVTGDGVTVAVLDTGIDDAHPDLDDAVVHQKDFTGEGTTEDKYGHGTHVAGIIAGDGSASNGTYTGIAPDAELYNVRVLGKYGYGYTSDIVAGMEHAVDNGADVLSMSLGGSPDGLRSNDPYSEAVNYAYDNGVPVVVSAGNSGDYGYGTVGSPGIAKHAITVGATDKSGGITSFSSRGPTPYGLYMKPDVVGPGANVVSTRASDTSMGDPVDDHYTSASGTSMSAPIVSGTAALMLDEHSDWSPQRVKSVLTTTADPLSADVNEYKQGAGMVNATEAVDSDVVVTPGTVDFGTYTNDTNVSRVVTVQNLGDSSVTLNVSASAESIAGDTGKVSVNESTITLSGGETAHLGLAVDTNTPAGVYSGRLSFDGGRYTGIFGYARAHTVTVEKNAIDTTSADDDPIWLFADTEGTFKTSGFRGLDQLDNGTTTYHLLSDGTYNILSSGVNENNNQSILLSHEVSVSSDTSVTLDESNTVEYDLNTTEPNEIHGRLFNKSVEVQYEKRTSSDWWYAGGVFTQSVGTQTMRFSTDDRLNVSVEHVLVPEADVDTDDPSYDVPTIYHLIHGTAGVSTGRTFDVKQDDLAAKNTSYYRTSASQSYWAGLAASNTEWEPMVRFALADDIGDRRTQTVYVSPDSGRYEHFVYGESLWNTYGKTDVFRPGERVERDVNRHPLTGNVTGWDVSDGNLNFTAVPQSTQAIGTRTFDDFEWDETLEVRLDGSTELRATDYMTYGQMTVGDGGYYDAIPVDSGTDIVVEMHADNQQTLSERTVTTFETTYVPGEDNTPPLIERANVVGMNHDGTAPIEPMTVRFTVRNQSRVDAENVTAWLSPGDATTVPSEDASDWSQASIARVDDDTYEATLTPTDPDAYIGTVDLALRVTEDNGDTVEITTFDAFRGADTAPPRISVATSPSERVSQYNPAAVTVERTDLHPKATELVIEDNSSGDVVHERDLSSGDIETQTTVNWNATDASGTPVESGEYDVVVQSSDAYGNANVTATTLTVDNKKPTATVTAVGATTDPTSTEGPVYTNGTVGLEATANGTPGEAEQVKFVLSADFTNFRVPVSGDPSDGGTTWTGVGNLSDVPDDGNYTVDAVAVDPADNRGVTTTETTVVLDRDEPVLGATVEKVGNDGRVTLTSNEPLESVPTATVEKPAGNDEQVTLTRNTTADGYVWEENFALAGDGNYSVTASGTDLAGNVGKTNSSAEIETLNVTSRNVTVVLEKSGLFIEFRTDETDFSSTVTITESRSALAPLSRNLAGLNFLNGELGTKLTEHLDNATIGIPANESRLPPGIDEKHVDVGYYDESDGSWELLDTSVEDRTVGNETRTYWVTEVEHFSTYGAVADDQEPPTLDAKSPTATFDHETTRKTVRFDYSDDISGVDASAVELYFDGQRVTDENAATVTGSYATYDATGLDAGDHEAVVTLEDEAGNAKNYSASFTIEKETTGDGGGGGSGGGGGGGGSDVPPPSVLVEITELTDTYAEGKVTNARASNPGEISFDGGLVGEDVTFTDLRFVPKSSDAEPRFFVEAESAGSAPSGVDAFDGADETLGYLTVTPKYISDSELDAVTVAFDVDSATAGSPENVALYRYNDSTWSNVETTFVDEQDGSYRFEASADATGTYAVGLATASFEVSDATLDASSVEMGEEVTVTATVENVGTGEGTYTVELTMDGEVVATEQVTLAGGEETTVEFVRTFEAGEHAVAVGSTEAGVLTVSADGSDDAAIDDEENRGTKQSGQGSGPGIPGFGIPAALAALLLGALLARRGES